MTCSLSGVNHCSWISRNSDTSIVLLNLEEEQTYCFRVYAKTDVVTSSPSEPTEPVLIQQELGMFNVDECLLCSG